MNIPVSRLNDPVMQAVPAALMRAAERARRLAEQTGTRFVVRPSATPLSNAVDNCNGTDHTDNEGELPTPGESA